MKISQQQKDLLNIILKSACKDIQYALFSPFMERNVLEIRPKLLEDIISATESNKHSFEQTIELVLSTAPDLVIKEFTFFIEDLFESTNKGQEDIHRPWIKYSVNITSELIDPKNDKKDS